MELINPKNLVISLAQWQALMPMVIVAIGSMVALLVGTLKIKMRKKLVYAVSILTLLAAMFWNIEYWGTSPVIVFNMLHLDDFSSFFNILLSATGLLVILGGYRYLQDEELHFPEYYVLLLVSILGMMSLVSTVELITLFIALETMSLGVYVLVGMRRRDIRSNEAAIKYFILGGVASALLLYGIALVYGALNTTNLLTIAQVLGQDGSDVSNPILILGVVLIFVGFFFKVAAFPFHIWTPDVYEGAPIIVTSFMSTALKIAVFGTFIRVSFVFLNVEGLARMENWGNVFHHIIWWLALATMIIGNFVALTQKNLKRLLAYSAIAHTGYLMMGILVGPKVGYSSMLMYFIPYAVMTIGAFTVLSIFSGEMDKDSNIEYLKGMGYRYPWLGVAMTIFLFSLSGFPPTAGFVAKYFLFSAVVQSGEIVLALTAILTSVVSVYYYLRIVIFMYMKEPGEEQIVARKSCTFAALAITACVLLTLQIGLFPSRYLEISRQAAVPFSTNQ